jgi:hypothetical protein
MLAFSQSVIVVITMNMDSAQHCFHETIHHIIIAMHWFSVSIHPSSVILAGVSSVGLFFWVYFHLFFLLSIT